MNKRTCKKLRLIARQLPEIDMKDRYGKKITVNNYRRIKRAYLRDGTAGILTYTNKVAKQFAMGITREDFQSVVEAQGLN